MSISCSCDDLQQARASFLGMVGFILVILSFHDDACGGILTSCLVLICFFFIFDSCYFD